MKRALAALALLLSLGCDGALTEILVVVDTDLGVPAEIDAVRVEVTGSETMTATGSLAGGDRAELPRTVGVVRNGGSLGPIRIRVVGSLGGTDVVERRAVTSFIEGRTLVLPMFLARSCQGVPCPDTQTCERRACVSATVDPAQLDDYGRDPGRLDAGCTATDEICNGTDEDCDGRVDEDFDLDSDPLNCGACLRPCALPNATEGCAGGACTVASCDAGFDDCNGEASDGCEQSLDVPDHCGACGFVCPPLPNASASCAAGACALGACDPGFGDCDATTDNGCERPLTTATDCGACDVACTVTGGSPECATGACTAVCDALLGDCDGEPTDCETPLDTTTDCGACGVACTVTGGTPDCSTGTCAAVCDALLGDCDAVPTDCETALTTLSDCGGCGVPCALPNASEECDTGVCRVLACDASFGDCDGDPANGCEADLRRNDAHCGTCGNACPAGQRCRPGGCS